MVKGPPVQSQINDQPQKSQGGDILSQAVSLKEQLNLGSYKSVFLARINNLLLIDQKSNYLTALDFSLSTIYDFSILER